MAASSGGPPGAPGSGKAALPERVAQIYYALGLVCTTYPTTIITLAVTVVILCCYPLVNLPLPGNLPQVTSNSTLEPWCHIQQITIRSAVVPWSSGLALTDAFRAPLYEVFTLLDVVRNFQHRQRSLQHLCLHVEAVKRGHEEVMPQYACLVLSPANLWKQDVEEFRRDGHLLNTIYNHQNIQKGKTSVAELLFGMNLKEAGIKRYPLRNRQRVLQYAITLVFKHYDAQFVASLKHKLETLYPLHQPNKTITNPENLSKATEVDPEDIVYIYFPGVFNYVEFVPLAVTFTILFFYIYFSVRKIEIIKSKVGMAFAAVMTVLGSLFMSVGLCFFFGLTLSMQGKEIFPYLVILVGLENVLVLTKSVVSTPQHLDVKIRIAQGLSKEGWSITKNILVEITIMTIGLATFVPVIQEFCIFAITGLISDFFLQMFFFSTILGIDIHRMEITAEKTHTNFRNSLYQNPAMYDSSRVVSSPSRGMSRSKSHPRLNTHSVAPGHHPHDTHKIPKRLRLVNIWARTRFFQRAFMVWMVVWISIIVYNSGILESVGDGGLGSGEQRNAHSRSRLLTNHTPLPSLPLFPTPSPSPSSASEASLGILRTTSPCYPRLPAQHWPALFSRYNVSLAGARIAVLPCIRLAHAVSPHAAEMLRHPGERGEEGRFHWPALAAALDPIDFYELSSSQDPPSISPFYPNSPMEIFLSTILCVISVIVLAYCMVVLYRCVCTRNYAEWRASWAERPGGDDVGPGTAKHLVMDAVPTALDGHHQEVECLVSDGTSVVSSDLGGVIKVWDVMNGEVVCSIDRKVYFGAHQTSPSPEDDAMLSDYESGSPPSRDEHSMSFPSLQYKINTNFSNLKLEPVQNVKHSRSFDFGEQYRQLYLNHHEARDGVRIRGGSDTARWIINQASQNFSRNTTNRKSSSEDRKHSGSTEDCSSYSHVPPIWCIDFMDNLIVLGCANGRIEFWEGTTGKLKCIFEDGSGLGVTSLKLIGSRVIVAKLNGSLDFLQLQSYSQGRQIDWGFTSAYRRTHLRSGSTGSLVDYPTDPGEDLRCIRVSVCKAHGQPVTVLDAEGGRVVSGSQDHTLRVFRLEDAAALYTLHGHCGPITCLFIDRVQTMTAGSGSQPLPAVMVCTLSMNRHVMGPQCPCSVYKAAASSSRNTRSVWSWDPLTTLPPSASSTVTLGYNAAHLRSGSTGSLVDYPTDPGEDLRCIRVSVCKAHGQPVTVLDAEGGRVVSGSQDHTLRVFRLEDAAALYTLHGHCGPITCLFIDRVQTMTAGSGSQDGLVCVWDLATGACMYSAQAHDGSVTSITYSASYVISLGTDSRLCVWERFQGHLLHSIPVVHAYTAPLLMLTHHLLVAARHGSLVVLDVRTGETLRQVQLGHRDAAVFVKQQLLLRDASVVCDYGSQLRVVRFPLIAHKFE